MASPRFSALIATGIGLLLGAFHHSAEAAVQTWTGATSGTWETSANWNTAVPGTGDIAQWDSTSTGNLGITLSAAESVLGLKVLSPSGGVTLSSGTLTIGASGIDMSAATQNLTIDSGLTLAAGNQAWNVATGRTLTINTSAFTRNAGATLLLDQSANTGTVSASTISNANGIVGPWAVVKSSGAAANNSSSGYTYATVSGGNILAYTGATAASTAGSVWGGISSAGTGLINYDLSIAGTTGSANSSYYAANTLRYTGAGMTQPGTAIFYTNGIMNAGTGLLTIGTPIEQANQTTNEIVLAAESAGINITGGISNNGSHALSVTITGANTVTLSGANSYTGNTTINASALTIGGTAAQTLSGVVSGTGSLIQNGSGTLTLGGSNTYSGGATVNAGTLVAGNASALGSGIFNLNGGAFGTNAGLIIANPVAVTGSNVIGWASQAANSITLTGALTGSGTLSNFIGSTGNYSVFFNGNNSGFTGTLNYTDVTANGSNNTTGWWRVGSSSGGTTDFSNATLNLIHNSSSDTLNFGFDDAASGATLDIGALSGDGEFQAAYNGGTNTIQVGFLNTSTTFAGTLSGPNAKYALNFVKVGAGTLTFTGANPYTGTTTISSGTLQLGNGGTTGSLSASSAITDNGTLTINRSNAVTQGTDFSSGIGGSGSVTQNGAGNLILSASNSYSGGTVLNSGTLTVSNSSALGTGTLSLNAGTLTNTGAGITLGNAIAVNGSAAVKSAGTAGSDLILNGNLTGSGTLSATATYNATGLRFGGTNSGFSGTLIVPGTAGNVKLESETAGSSSAVWVVNGGLETDATGANIFNLGSLSGSGEISGHFAQTSTAVQTLNIGALNANTTFSGVIKDNTVAGDAFSNNDSAANNRLALTKVGTGAMTLSGSNTYTGATSVNGGTLIVSGSISGSTAVTASTGGILEVDGSLNKAVTANINAAQLQGNGVIGGAALVSSTLSAGYDSALSSPATGMLTSGSSVSLDSNSTFAVRLGLAVGGGDNDSLSLTSGSATLGNANLQLTLGSNIGNAPVNTLYAIITGANPVNGAFASLGSNGSPISVGGYTFDIYYNVNPTNIGASGDAVVLDLVSVPEPGSVAAVLYGTCLLAFPAWYRARRRKP